MIIIMLTIQISRRRRRRRSKQKIECKDQARHRVWMTKKIFVRDEWRSRGGVHNYV